MATATVTPRMARKHVCTYDELPKGAKNNAREWMRDLQQEDFGRGEFLLEPAETAAAILGIEFQNANRNTYKPNDYEPDIRWSGFSSQGDGASFVGTYSHAPQSPAKIRAEFPTETALHKIADGLDSLQCGYKLLTGHRINANITQNDHGYVHKYTMDCTVEDSETQEELCWDGEETKRLRDLMRDFAQWIYDGLEKEYEYMLSDEAIEETIRANEYQFQAATGKVV